MFIVEQNKQVNWKSKIPFDLYLQDADSEEGQDIMGKFKHEPENHIDVTTQDFTAYIWSPAYLLSTYMIIICVFHNMSTQKTLTNSQNLTTHNK